MRLTKFRRQVCPNQFVAHAIARENPINWIIPAADNRYAVFPLYGYIVGIAHGGITAIFEKAAYRLEPGENPGNATFPIRDVLASTRMANVALMADLLGVPFHLFAWGTDFPEGWSVASEGIRSMYEVRLQYEKESLAARIPTQLSITDFRHITRTYRGGSLRNSRALKSSDSRLECYLSAVPFRGGFDPWPGDLDAVVYDTVSHRITALVEFKTHNSQTPVINEWLGKYPEDGYRADVLFRLSNAITTRQGQTPALYYIVWGTAEVPNHANISITKLDNRSNLRGCSKEVIQRPPFDAFSPKLFDLVTM